ncbi:MAG: carbon-nitrogen hydrolase family protein [Clostridiales bacterium]|nr:carbon-nitrogen hydrolase family protein [Clostridiales bacterium]
MKISLIQMNVVESKEANLRRAAELISSAAGSDLIMLPEMFCCPYAPASFVENAEPEGGRVFRALSEMAKSAGAYLIGGSMPELSEGRIYNTCFVFDPEGRLAAKHRKAHLFDVDIAGGQRFMESETLSAGKEATVFSTPFGNIGVCICFDVRFPEFIHEMKGMDLLAVPAAFNMTTGPLHWELLFRARAVDEQVFTLGCAPARDENGGYVSYANSIAVDPWGRVIARAGAEETVLSFGIDVSEAKRVRRQIPTGR